MIANSMDERTGRTAIGHAIEAMMKNETCVTMDDEKCYVKAGQLYCAELTGKLVRRTMHERAMDKRTLPFLKSICSSKAVSSGKKCIEKKAASMGWHKVKKKIGLNCKLKGALVNLHRTKDAYEVVKVNYNIAVEEWMKY